MPKPPARPKAYSYIRFSTPEQQRGDSLRRQTAAAAKWAKSRGLDLDNSSYQDLGVSAFRGDNAETGMLGEFREAVADGIVAKGSFLLIENLDRLSRDKPRKAVRLLEEICESGITVVTLSDQKEYSDEALDADPLAMMWAFMTAIRANEESILKSRRTREGWTRIKDAAASHKRPMTSRLPAWLALTDDRSRIVFKEDRVEVIRRIFQEATAGAGQHRIARKLTDDGVPTFGDTKRRAATWQRSYVKKILSNPAVVGTMIPHSTRVVNGKRIRDPLPPIHGYYPPVVSQEDFDQVNAAIASRTAPRMRGTTGAISSLLAGLAKCPHCGATMTRVNKGSRGGTPYLLCVSAKAGNGCVFRQVRVDMVEAAMREKAADIFIRDMPAAESELNVERERLLAQQFGVIEGIDNLVAEVERGSASAAIRRHLSRLEVELAALEAKIALHEEIIGDDIRLSVEKKSAVVIDTLRNPEATPAEINGALRGSFSECVVNYPEGTLDFYWLHSETPTRVMFAWPREEEMGT